MDTQEGKQVWVLEGVPVFNHRRQRSQGGGEAVFRQEEKQENSLSENQWESFKRKWMGGFPGGAVVESLPANAGDTGSSPGLGGSHMLRSDWAREPRFAEPARLEPVLCNERGRDGERPAHRDEEWPPLAAAGGSPRAEAKTQHSHK